MLLSVVVAVLTPALARADQLRRALADINDRRVARELSLKEAEAEYLALLERHPGVEDQMRIYLSLVALCTQRSPKLPTEGIKYIDTLLEMPIDVEQQVQLLIWKGGCFESLHKADLVKARREAVRPRLEALKLCLDQNLPEKAPTLPKVTVPGWIVAEKDSPYYQRWVAERKQQEAARQKAQFQINMVEKRDASDRHIVYLYSRSPFATEELRQVAQQILGEKHQKHVDSLVQRVEGRIQEKLKKAPLDDLGDRSQGSGASK